MSDGNTDFRENMPLVETVSAATEPTPTVPASDLMRVPAYDWTYILQDEYLYQTTGDRRRSQVTDKLTEAALHTADTIARTYPDSELEKAEADIRAYVIRTARSLGASSVRLESGENVDLTVEQQGDLDG